MQPKRLSIIIITWNESRTIDRCLKSFYERFDFNQDEIIVIDNGSTDETGAVITSNYPNVRYYSLPENIGVGPARNRGIMMSKGNYLMTLDNDTIIGDCNFGEIVDSFFSNHPEAGVVGCRLLNADMSHQQSCRRFPGWLQPFAARISFLSKVQFFQKIQSTHMMEDIDFESCNYPLEVDYVLGANQIFTAETAMRLYGYDERIFFGPEDFDFCFRAKKLGKKNYLVDTTSIIHDYQRRTRKFSALTVKHIIFYYYVMIKNKVSWA